MHDQYLKLVATRKKDGGWYCKECEQRLAKTQVAAHAYAYHRGLYHKITESLQRTTPLVRVLG